MKYAYYIALILLSAFRKPFGIVWYPFVVPFRGYARSVVHNYRLNNGIPMSRTADRKYEKLPSGDWFIPAGHGTQGGYLRYRKTNWLQYQLVFWLLWGWVDDDSYYDVTDKPYIMSLVRKDNGTWYSRLIVRKLNADLDKMVVPGNAFDIGTKREDYPICLCLSGMLWNIRNSGYNFQYALHERADQPFMVEIKGRAFGWRRKWNHGYELVFMSPPRPDGYYRDRK